MITPEKLAAYEQIANGAKLLESVEFNTTDFVIAWKEMTDGLDALDAANQPQQPVE